MKHYLYLLSFKSENLFKIGVSKNNLTRVFNHHATYGIDFKNSYIIEANSRVVKFLEMELLCLFDACMIEKYKNKDGYTEIRDKKYLPEAIELISLKPKKLGITFNKLNEFINSLPEKQKAKRTRKKKQPYIFNNDIWQKDVDGFLNTVSNLMRFVVSIEKNITDHSTQYKVILKENMGFDKEETWKQLRFFFKPREFSYKIFGLTSFVSYKIKNSSDISIYKLNFQFNHFTKEIGCKIWDFHKEALDKVKIFFEKYSNYQKHT